MTLRKIFENPDVFNLLMEEIDNEMKQQNVAIQGRSIAAGSIISKRFKCMFSWNSSEAMAIDAWFQQRYGERLKIDFYIGKTVVKIKQDLYYVNLPLVYGSIKLDVFTWIKDATSDLLRSLSPEELDIIGNQIIDHYRAYNSMQRLPSKCVVDLKVAVEHLTNQNPQYGLSKWASLQAAEKTLKEDIKKRGGDPPKVHNLLALSKMAEELGLPAVDKAEINNAQCRADVRYDDVSISEDAYAAYYASVQICRHVAKNFLP